LKTDFDGLPIAFDLTGGEKADTAHFETLMDIGDKPTLAAVALLHLKRTAAISAVEGHQIKRVNGRFGP
jgi:hypothetical protein